MDISSKLADASQAMCSLLFAPGSVFSVPSLLFAFCVAMGFLAWRQHKRRGHVRLDVIKRAVFRKKIMLHRSTLADVGYFFINTFALGGLIGWAFFSGEGVSKFVTAFLRDHLGAMAPSTAPAFVLSAGMTLLLFLAYEFGYWLDHYLKHRIPFLWEFHKTHHAAEVLTPWTTWRVHPLDTLIFANVLAIVVGSVGGVGNYLVGRDAPLFTVSGSNILLVFFIYAYVHLQHSQFWIPFTGAVGRVFMSPAHHQIHHSVDPVHFNRNMGSCLSLWDWLFGTLEIPATDSPHLVYGADYAGEDPHSVTTLLITPVTAAIGALFPKHLAPPSQAGGMVAADN
jgi:sterol desaturase/sphingolipid hydroxylase (fatty acid hydroxylase superfamily)